MRKEKARSTRQTGQNNQLFLRRIFMKESSFTLNDNLYYINQIFELEKKVIEKDQKIAYLELKIELQNQLYQSLKEQALSLIKL